MEYLDFINSKLKVENHNALIVDKSEINVV